MLNTQLDSWTSLISKVKLVSHQMAFHIIYKHPFAAFINFFNQFVNFLILKI